ncbi:uncharacterized mitochondrial protein AtMg00810-like [Aristolochia californica]|uniref:uncharacterized mitochondrial protein AtMg00810-like n=1 Tax=Aristolochia californica TaxID=171875 RepID=UPI0035DE2BAA
MTDLKPSSSSASYGSVPTICNRPPAFTEGKIDGTNYLLWKFKITIVLDSYELLDIVLGVDAEPVAVTDGGNTTPPNPQLVEDWRRKYTDALCAIHKYSKFCPHPDSTHFEVLHVDDLEITGDHEDNIVKTQEWLSQEFDMTDLGLLHYCLEIEVWQKSYHIFISQERYARELLSTFGMTESNPVVTPMEVNTKLSINDLSGQVDNKLYIKLVGRLIFLCNTRPDIIKFYKNLFKGMWILKYLKGTLTFGVSYTSRDILYGYCDLDWAGDIDMRKSVTCYEFMFGSGIISWASKKQKTVALSSTEAEYKATCVAAYEVVWLRRILNYSATLNCDSQSCIAMAKNPIFHARIKHIEIQYHYVRDLIEEETLYMEYNLIEDNHADIFTKALGSAQMNKHLRGLGVGPRT